MAHKYPHKIIPQKQDLDTETRYMGEGTMPEILNGRLGTSDEQAQRIWENIRGTKEVVFELPEGINKCIGWCEDVKNQRLYYLVWNSLGYNGIYAYQPQDTNEKIKLLFGDTPDNKVLDFSEFHLATVKLHDSKYIKWVEHNYNPPRCIRLDWCYVTKKSWIIDDLPGLSDYHVLIDGEIISMGKASLDVFFDIDDCDCMKVTQKDVQWHGQTMQAEIKDGVALNFYDLPHNERQIDYVKYPLSLAPKVNLQVDGKFRRNLIGGNTWQFRAQLKYTDGTYSAWSPYSKMVDTTDRCSSNYNSIVIDYNDPIFDLFNDLQQLQTIEKVILGYRNTNIGKLYKFAEISVCDLRKDEFKYTFYNDIYAEIIDDITEQKQYDCVPLQAGELEIIADRVGFADITENYDGDCGNFELDVKFYPKKTGKVATVRTKIRIQNFFMTKHGDNQPIARFSDSSGPDGTNKDYTSTVFGGMPGMGNDDLPDRYDQYLPDGGWWGYLRGTDFKGLSKQIKIDGIDYYNADRGIIDLRTNDNRIHFDTAVSSGKKVYSILDINDVPYGTYIFCLASHLVSEPIDGSDKLGYGKYYDASNNLFQKTSTQVIGIKENGVYKDKVTEFMFTIDDTTVVNGVFTLPDFYIQDVTKRDEAVRHGSAMVNGYVLDNDGFSGGNTTLEKFAEGTPVELADFKAYIKIAGFGSGEDFHFEINRRKTDHNGFYFSADNFDDVLQRDIHFRTQVRDVGMPDEDFINTSENIYKGRLTSIYDGTAEALPNNNLTVGFTRNVHINIPNYNPNITKYNRTHIKGVIRNQSGAPLQGITIVCTDTGRVEISGQDGSYDLVVYVNSGGQTRKGTLIFYDERGCITKDFTLRSFDITLGSGAYNNTHAYPLDLVINTDDIGLSYFLKNGDVYDFGMTYMDRANRKNTVQFNEKKHRLRLPFTTEYIKDYLPQLTTDADGVPINATTKANGYFEVSVIFKEQPPIWTTHALILRTPGQVYESYVQMVVSDVKYVEKYDTKIVDNETVEDITETTYGSSTANEIYLDLQTSFAEYQKRNSESKKGWAFEKGDRLRFILKSDGTLREFVDVEIKEQRGNYFVIPVMDSLDEIKKGEVVEVLRIKTKTEKHLFYEIGEYNKVLNPYTPLRAWENTTVVLNTGDAYRRNRKMYAKNDDGNTTYIHEVEDPSPSDRTILKDNDIGRPDFVNSNYKQLRREDVIRFSGQYISESLINNSHSFAGLDEVVVTGGKGAITIMDSYDDVLFVAQYDRCHTRHINKTTAFLGDGQEVVYNSDRFLSAPYYMSENAGCRNKESHQRKENGCLFFDTHRGVIWEYNKQAGLQNTSGYDQRYKRSGLQERYYNALSAIFKLIPDELHVLIVKCQGGYDFKNTEYNLTILPIDISLNADLSYLNGTGSGSNIGDNDPQFKKYTTALSTIKVDGKTNIYSDKWNAWFGFRSYQPEMYASIGRDLLSFVGGKLYENEKGDKYVEFYGVKYKQVITPVFNKNPSDLKKFQNFSIESNERWSNPLVKVFNSRAFRDIESNTPDAMIKQQNGGFNAAFLKDTNTPNKDLALYNGNDLVGETLMIRLENESDNHVLLFAVNIYADYMPRSNF